MDATMTVMEVGTALRAGDDTTLILPAYHMVEDLPPGCRLTRREHEILRLLSHRLTDAEIGEVLFISPRTVSSHVANILTKLGVSNRRLAGAVAARHRLL